jgi:hypothetical protein
MPIDRLASALLALLVSAAAAAQPAPIALPAGGPPTVSLAVTAEVEAAPDIATIGSGVVTQAPGAEATLRANSERMARVVAAIRKAGVAERDVQTMGVTLQPQFRYAENQPPALVGFEARNRVQVTLRDVRRAGPVIDALVAEGANQIDGPSFAIENPDPLLDRARGEAVARGRARADLYAKAAGLRVKRVLSISETVDFRPPPRPLARTMAMEAQADTPVAPGQVELAVTVAMLFELE